MLELLWEVLVVKGNEHLWKANTFLSLIKSHWQKNDRDKKKKKCSCVARIIFLSRSSKLWQNGRASGDVTSGRWRCRQVCWHPLTNMIRLAAVVGEGKCTAASWLFTQDEWVTQNARFNPSGVFRPVYEKDYDRLTAGRCFSHSLFVPQLKCEDLRSVMVSSVEFESLSCFVLRLSWKVCGDILHAVTNLLVTVVNWELTNGGRLKKDLKQPLSHFCHPNNVKWVKYRR